MKKFLGSFLCAVLGGVIFAQSMERIPQIKITDSDKKAQVRVYEVERVSEVVGNIQSTTIEYMIENKSNRILEGEFEFPLADGEKVTGFALDINGTLRQAVAVEKEKGREVFESVVRKNVDPALLEMTAGNNFKTRVYPIPASGVRHLSVTVEKEIVPGLEESGKVYFETEGKDSFFYFYNFLPDESLLSYIPEVSSLSSGSKVSADSTSISVLFDVSGSAANRDLNKEIAFLKCYVNRLLELGLKVKIQVVTFSNSVNEDRNFLVKSSSDFDALSSFLRNQTFDGATSLPTSLPGITGEKVLLFSDGIANWGNSEDSALFIARGPVFAVNSSKSADFMYLKKIARENDGEFLNLCELSEQAACDHLFARPMKIISVECDSGIEEVYPRKGEIVSGGFSVAGVLKRKSGKIKISVGRNGKVEAVIEKVISVVPSKAEGYEFGVESSIVQKLWAVKKIEALDEDYSKNKNQIIELAKKFTIVTKDTSLIVLDSVQDYIRYGIVPPAELKAEYDRLTSGRSESVVKNVRGGIARDVYNRFEEFKRWWKMSPGEFKKLVNQKPDGAPRASVLLHGEVNESTPYDDSEMNIEYDRLSGVVSEEVWAGSGYNSQYYSRALSASENEIEVPALFEAKAPGTSGASNGPSQASVSLQAWSSNAEYLSVLKKTPADLMYSKYLELKKEYEKSPAFFMEVSDYFAEENQMDLSLRILSNLAEMNMENTDVLRALGNKLIERNRYDEAIPVFEKLTHLKAEVPQFYRDLALACNLAGQKQKAVESLWKIVSGTWDNRYNEIQQIALNDMNAIIANASKKDKIDTSSFDKALLQNFDVDLRIVLTWNTDDCDVDLWVTDPDGEKCYYGHNRTLAGARISRDFTQGYGPEEFCLKVAPKGKYKIEANYYGTRQQKLLQPVIVQAEVYTNFGRQNQERKVLTLQLDNVKQTFFIGEIEVSL